MRCSKGRHIAIRCNTLQHTATDKGGETSPPLYNTLQQGTSDRNKGQYPATCCNMLQLTATYCNTLQHTRATRLLHHCETHWNSGHRTATHCNTPKHAATDEGDTISSPLSIMQLQHSTLQHTRPRAVHTTLTKPHLCKSKCVAVYCSVLQRSSAAHLAHG